MNQIIQQEGTDLLAEIDYRDGSPGWVTIAYVGGTGIIIDDAEWDAFIQLILNVNIHAKAEREKRKQNENSTSVCPPEKSS